MLDSARKVFSYLFETPLSERGALEIPHSSDLVCQLLALLPLDGVVTIVREGLQRLLVLPQIYFGS